MSQLFDEHKLFELVQLVGLGHAQLEPGGRRRSVTPGEPQEQQRRRRHIHSYSATSCGTGIVFIVVPPEQVESGEDLCYDEPHRPLLGAVRLTGLPPFDKPDSFEDHSFKVQWMFWFRSRKLHPTCIAVSPDDQMAAIGCVNGSVFSFATSLLLIADAAAGPSSKAPSDGLVQVIPAVSDGQSSRHSPSCLCWFVTLDNRSLLFMGTRAGSLLLIDSGSGALIGRCDPSHEAVVRLQTFRDEFQDTTFLLITNASGKQWRLLVERRSTNYLWSGCKDSEEAGRDGDGDFGSNASCLLKLSASHAEKRRRKEEEEEGSDEHCEDISTRSRLAGLRQMSVASLASLRQRLSDSKKILDLRAKVGTGSGGIWAVSTQKDMNKVALSSAPFDDQPKSLEPLCLKVGDTRLSVQMSRDKQILSGLFPDTSILTLHNSNLEVLSQVAFRLPRQSERVHILNKIMLVSSGGDRAALQVVSGHHAEIHLDNSRSREETILQHFVLAHGERVLGFQLLQRDAKAVPPDDDEPLCGMEHEDNDDSCSGLVKDSHDRFLKHVQSRVLRARKQGYLLFEPCVVVTTAGVYVLRLMHDPVTAFLEFAVQGDMMSADYLAATFNLDSRGLIELAADTKLSKKDCPSAIVLYRMSGCKHLKAVLKFASSGHVPELLSYLSILFKTPNVDWTLSDRIHLSNLTLMAYFQQVLTKNASVDAKADFCSKVCAFMDDNHWFDDSLALKLAAETKEWGLLLHLCRTRGLHEAMLALVADALGDATPKALLDMSVSERKHLWACLSHPDNLTSCLANPVVSRNTLKLVTAVMTSLSIQDVEVQVQQSCLDRPDFRPLLRPIYLRAVHSSAGPWLCDQRDTNVRQDLFITELVHFHLVSMLTVIKKEQQQTYKYDPDLVKVWPADRRPSASAPLVRIHTSQTSRLLGVGPSHVLVIRPKSGSLYSWGATHFGVLGHSGSPSLSTPHSPPQRVAFFDQINAQIPDYDGCESHKLEVLSVACGRSHSMALTNCGLYVWGSSKFGQLGLGKDLRRSYQPRILDALCEHVPVVIAAGHYHSAALDAQGRLWTWGWGVHGQLGLGHVEDAFRPTRVLHPAMLEETAVTVSAGYAHTLVLTAAGHVWAFGSGLFGQLGLNGHGHKKSTLPVKVDIRNDRIGSVACGYFHNMAVSEDGQRLYTWGCSPQLLRLEAQKKRKDRRLQQQQQQQQQQHQAPAVTPSTVSTNDGEDGGDDGDDEDDSMGKANGDEADPKEHQVPPDESRETLTHLLPSLVDTSGLRRPIVSVTCGNHHSLIVTEEGQVYTCSRPSMECSSSNSSSEFRCLSPVSALCDEVVRLAACGGDYFVAMTECGSVYAWGNNNDGQLGKPPLDKESDKIVVMKGTKRIVRVPQSNQNACDVPKVVMGLTSGVYSEESHDSSVIHKRFVSGVQAMADTVALFGSFRLPADLNHRLHQCIETFHPYLDCRKLIKKCLTSGNIQAAAKLSLLSEATAVQAFDLTLQACIKLKPPDPVQQHIFEAFHFYIHFQPGQAHLDAVEQSTKARRLLLERLIFCWQDQKFSFTLLERLFLERADLQLLQLLVLTLFCPDRSEDGDDDDDDDDDDAASGDDGPVVPVASGEAAQPGPKLVDLFSPEFCLKIGDTFVKSIRNQVPDSPSVTRWLALQRQSPGATSLSTTTD